MTTFFLYTNLTFLAVSMILLLLYQDTWSRMLALELLTTLTSVEFVLYSLHTGLSMYLDIALVCVLLGFMEVQFFAVFFRKKGDL